MRERSHRHLGVAAAALVVLGWTLGSTLAPPVALTEGRAAIPRLAATPIAQPPRLALPIRRIAPKAPRTGRNPFVFESEKAPASEARELSRSRAVVGETIASDVADPAALDAVAPRWQLAGIAEGPGAGMTAVITGPGGVHLARAGDALPGGWSVVTVDATSAELHSSEGVAVTLALR